MRSRDSLRALTRFALGLAHPPRALAGRIGALGSGRAARTVRVASTGVLVALAATLVGGVI
ncbi:hypothetical protein [Halobaculum rubrum]|uniref:hypothetical protein n=1 Tax=Halobaculum rubrum TaxID=2872158 RepID=UPI001CA40AE5|nr:hypothetical protein [Halobaculum rubrum]QZY00817.1 hypothetical protein K6T25_07060 [Halobaculum rubrum]